MNEGIFVPVCAAAPGKAAKTLNRGPLTASLQLRMAYAACREWLHSAVFQPEKQLMQLLQLSAYKKTERHLGDTWADPPPPMPWPKRESQMTTLTTLTAFIAPKWLHSAVFRLFR